MLRRCDFSKKNAVYNATYPIYRPKYLKAS